MIDIGLLLRLDPTINRLFLEAPVRSDFEPGQFPRRSVLIYRKRLHPEILGEFLDRKDAVAVNQ